MSDLPPGGPDGTVPSRRCPCNMQRTTCKRLRSRHTVCFWSQTAISAETADQCVLCCLVRTALPPPAVWGLPAHGREEWARAANEASTSRRRAACPGAETAAVRAEAVRAEAGPGAAAGRPGAG